MATTVPAVSHPPTRRPRPARLDVRALARVLDGEHLELRRRIRRVLSDPAFVRPLGITRDRYRALVLEWLRALADDGLGLIGYPREVDGGADPAGGIVVFETLAYGDLSLLVKFGVQFGLFGGAIAQLGSPEQRTLLSRVGTLDLVGCFALTETGHGSNARDVRTTARYDQAAEGFVIDTPDDDARKDYIGNAALHAHQAVVFAQLEADGRGRGVHAFLVPIRDGRGRARRGVRIEDCGEKLGLNGVDNGRLWFSRVRVPREALLGRFGTVDADGRYTSPIEDDGARFFATLGALVAGRVSIAAAAVSTSKSALTIAIRYGERRRQFGPPGGPETPILDYPTHQRRLLPALATTYALDFAAKHLTAEYGRSAALAHGSTRERRQVEYLAAGVKAVATWHATETIQTCREACGGAGYLAENRLAALKADTDVFTTFEGDNTVLLQLVAKGLLTGYREEFGDMDLPATLRYLAGRVAGTIAEAVPTGMVAGVLAAVRGGRASGEDDHRELRDRRFQLKAFRFRERHLLDGLARRMRQAVAQDGDPMQALMTVQDHMVTTALAHTERVVLERFSSAVRGARGPGVGRTLRLLCDLYALSRIERDRGWFLEHGFLSPARSKAVLREVDGLCREVRPLAAGLVDAFGVPDAVLAAPIATGRKGRTHA